MKSLVCLIAVGMLIAPRPTSAGVIVSFNVAIDPFGFPQDHPTNPVTSSSVGINPGDVFRVDDTIQITNLLCCSLVGIRLQTLQNGVWVDSNASDGISFNQLSPFSAWVQNVHYEFNGVDMGPSSPGNGGLWEVARVANANELIFYLNGGPPNYHGPTDSLVLSFHFDMLDTGNTTWRLTQRAQTLPEPATMPLTSAVLALIGLIGKGRIRATITRSPICP
jgi:hypothetical protein